MIFFVKFWKRLILTNEREFSRKHETLMRPEFWCSVGSGNSFTSVFQSYTINDGISVFVLEMGTFGALFCWFIVGERPIFSIVQNIIDLVCFQNYRAFAKHFVCFLTKHSFIKIFRSVKLFGKWNRPFNKIKKNIFNFFS